MTDQKPSPEPEYTPQETAALEAEIDAFLPMARRFTVEVGRIDPAAVPLSEILKLGPNAGLLADLTDSLCAGPDDGVDLGDGATDEDRLRFSVAESRQARIRQPRSGRPGPGMTPRNLQAAFPAAAGRDEAAGWIIDRYFLTKIIRRVWKSGRMLAVSSIDVQAILLAAIEIVDEGAAPATPTPPA